MSKKPSAPHYEFDSETIPYATAYIEQESVPLPAQPLVQPPAQPLFPTFEQQLGQPLVQPPAQPLNPTPKQQSVQPPVQPLVQPPVQPLVQPPVSPPPDLESNEPYHQQQEQRDGEPKVGEWGAGLCGWCDNCVPNCLFSTFCPCISLAQIMRRLGLYNFYWGLLATCVLWVVALVCFVLGVKTKSVYCSYWSDEGYPDCKDLDLLAAAYFSGFALPYIVFLTCIWRLRIRVRERFQIPGRLAVDFIASFACSCCVIAQMATHAQSYKPHVFCCSGTDMLPGYDDA